MPFLSILGWDIPVKTGAGDWSMELVGPEKIHLQGQPSIRYGRLRRQWTFETPVLPSDTADAVEGLISGVGNYFSFQSNLFGSAGGRPFFSVTWVPGTAGGKNGLCASAAAGLQQFEFLSYAYLYNHARTIMVYRDANVGSWTHHAFTDNGIKVINGVRNDAASTAFATWSTTSLSLDGGAGYKYDELVVVPYRMTPEQMIAHHTYMQAGNSYGNLRKLKAKGDFLLGANTEIRVRGFVDDSQDIAFSNAGSWDSTARSIRFRLVEELVEDIIAEPAIIPTTDLAHWVQGDTALQTHGTGVQFLDDLSGNNRDLYESINAAIMMASATTLNGKTGTLFKGSVGSGIIGQPAAPADANDLIGADGSFTIYMLATIPVVNGNVDDIIRIVRTGGPFNVQVRKWNGVPGFNLYVNDSDGNTGNGNIHTTVPCLLTVIADGVSTIKVYVDGSTTPTSTTTYQPPDILPEAGQIDIFKFVSVQDIILWELLWYKRAHSPTGAERTAIIANLSASNRWGNSWL